MPNCGTRSEFTIATIRSTRDSYRISNEVVNEPGDRDCREADPVTLQDEPVGHLGVGHGILLVPSRFFHAETPYKDSEGGDNAQTQRQSPDGPEVVLAKDPEEDERDERRYDKANINHSVCSCLSILARPQS